jgi:hypothetical protein
VKVGLSFVLMLFWHLMISHITFPLNFSGAPPPQFPPPPGKLIVYDEFDWGMVMTTPVSTLFQLFWIRLWCWCFVTFENSTFVDLCSKEHHLYILLHLLQALLETLQCRHQTFLRLLLMDFLSLHRRFCLAVGWFEKFGGDSFIRNKFGGLKIWWTGLWLLAVASRIRNNIMIAWLENWCYFGLNSKDFLNADTLWNTYNKSLSPNHVMMICTSYIRHIGDFTCVTLIIKPLLPLQTVLDEVGEFFLYPSYRMMCTFSMISERITSLSLSCARHLQEWWSMMYPLPLCSSVSSLQWSKRLMNGT